MDTPTLQRATGLAAVTGAIFTLIELPLYFVYGGPPPDWNILTRSLFGLLGLTALVVFMTGFGTLLKRLDANYDWAATLATTAGSMWLTVAFIGMGAEVGAAIQSPEDIDPTISVSLTYILYGSISHLLEALFFYAFGIAVLKTRLLPEWTGRSAFVLAVINLLFVLSLFFGNTPANFYAANGWGTAATLGGIVML
ncbi:hypothetical protein [Nocardia crassostreae]|uniref:hypothetical protein n=1 Tax=Nocardia crassostreae TaxID=53428 RepID=UPI000B1A2A94|nr:hypothetical protein [Nocardia crassostreae]